MNKYILQDAIGNIDDDLIEEANKAWKDKRKAYIKFAISSAACLILCFASAISVFVLEINKLIAIASNTPPKENFSNTNIEDILYGTDVTTVSTQSFIDIKIIILIIIFVISLATLFIIKSIRRKE